MTVVRAFRALRYDTERVDLSQVIVPPYDVIAADERETYYSRDPHNAIRFELTRDVADENEADYSEIADTLASWRASGVLVRDEAPAIYAMSQRFVAPGGETLERVGFYAALGLAEYQERVVRPHERTLAGPKADRLKVMRASRANLSSVFLLYEDREQEIAALLEEALAGDDAVSARDDAGVEYRVAAIRDPAAIGAIESFMANRPTVIADGHHRYETALEYRSEQRDADPAAPRAEAPYESTLAYFANAFTPGSLLLPIHRVIKAVTAPTDEELRERLPDWQVREVALPGARAIEEVLAKELAPLAGKPSFALDDGGGVLRIFWRDEPLGDALMVRIAEEEVIGSVFGLDAEAIREGAVSFPKSAARAALEVRTGDGGVALYLNPLAPDDVFRVTGRGEVMPQKSTFFYPKVPTGLVLRVHDANETG